MNTDAVIYGLTGTGFSLAGLALVYRVWRQNGGSPLQMWGGWLLVLAGLTLWSQTGGWVWGAALGLITLQLAVFIFILPRYRTPGPARETETETPADTPGQKFWPLFGRRIATALIASLGTAAATLLFCTLLFTAMRQMGVEASSNVVTAMFLFPTLWAALTSLVLMQNSLWRKAVWTGAPALLAGAGLVFI